MIVSVSYPKTATSTFDLDYYVGTHVPLVNRLWGPLGLRGAQVLKGTGSLGGAPAYELICLLDFASQEAFTQAAAAHADEVMGDIRNFTNVQPIVQFNEPVVTSEDKEGVSNAGGTRADCLTPALRPMSKSFLVLFFQKRTPSFLASTATSRQFSPAAAAARPRNSINYP